MTTHQFEVTVTVRKKIHVQAGDQCREAAREILQRALSDGININTFAVRGADGHPVETIIAKFTVDDPHG
jgi:hypothetical protein